MADIKKGPAAGSKLAAHVTIADRRQFLIGTAAAAGAAVLGTGLGLRPARAYEREHKEIFEPIAKLFAMVREIGTAITHCVGAFG